MRIASGFLRGVLPSSYAAYARRWRWPTTAIYARSLRQRARPGARRSHFLSSTFPGFSSGKTGQSLSATISDSAVTLSTTKSELNKESMEFIVKVRLYVLDLLRYQLLGHALRAVDVQTRAASALELSRSRLLKEA